MNCKYLYKGKVFNSELELNEYLLRTEVYKPILGDAVFQLSDSQNRYASILTQTLKEYEDIKDKGFQLKTVKLGEIEPEDLDDIGSFKYPYISVTDMIHTLPSRYTDLVFPIFISDNYWAELFKKYRLGIVNDYEKLFIQDLITETDSGIEAITNPDTLEEIRSRMEGKLVDGKRVGGLWKQLAMCGNMIHDMAAKFYRERLTPKGKHLYKCSRDEIINWFKSNTNPIYSKYLSGENKIIESTVDTLLKLDAEIRAQYGQDAYIRTEQPIVGDIDLKLENGLATKIIGKIDLLVVGKDGLTAIVDFKCSPKDYTTLNTENDPFLYNSAKILTFKYLLETYRQILRSMGIRNPDMKLFVVPLKFEGFKMEGDDVSFQSISGKNTLLQELSNSQVGDERSYITANLGFVFPNDRYIPEVDDIKDVITDVSESMKRQFPIPEKDYSEEGILKRIKDKGGIVKNDSTGEWEYRPYKNSDRGLKKYSGKLSEEQALVKLKEELLKEDDFFRNYGRNRALSLREAYILYYLDKGEDPSIKKVRELANKKALSKDSNYLSKLFVKYSHKDIWEIVSDPKIDEILNLYGILLFRNKVTNAIDVIRISTLSDPTEKIQLKKGKYLFGNFLKNDIAHPSADSETMISTSGNIELMETMHVLNRMHGVFNENGIGNIKLLCPRDLIGLEVPNHQLLYNFKRICSIDTKFKGNNFDKDLKLCTYVDLAKLDIREIIDGKSNHRKETGFDRLALEIKDAFSNFDFDIKDKLVMKELLLELDRKLVKHYPYVTENIKKEISDAETRLHADLLYAISELSGVKMLQQIEKHAPTHISSKGVSGTLIDNPGTLQSVILNLATEQITVAYLNTRDAIMHFDIELRKRIKALKDSKKFGWINLNLTGNQTKDLYLNMYDKKSHDLKFVNPWSPDTQKLLTQEEADFLKFALIKINATRRNLNLKELQQHPDKMAELIANDDSLLLVPMVKADSASEIATRGGIVNFVKDRFKYVKAIWDTKTRDELKQRINEKVTSFLYDTEKETNINEGTLWEAVNYMSIYDDPKNLELRRNKISRVGGTNYFEHNLETILLKHTSNYIMAEELNKVFPIIQTLALHLNLQGAILNDLFVDDLNYLYKYIKVRVHNQPFENRKGSTAIIKDVTDEMMKWSSRLALAFNPKQMYQFIDGIWKDIMLFIKLPDNTTAFSKENLVSAWKFAMEDLGHFGDSFSLQELLNMLYGMNDMDMNVYIDRIKTDNTGLFTHFWDTGFRFASRPDYYNRMTIFVALMKADGCFDAHIKKDGQWVYDWTKDKRFDVYAKYKGDSSKVPPSELKTFNKQKSEYITIARLLVEEGTRNPDGTLFLFDINHPKPLPKAYTNKQSESMKALSDRIYGYYAHEKKSMINSTWIGAMFMLMNNFWSAKKNQYLQERSYTLEGYFTDYVEEDENGNKTPWYWKIDENGELIPTTEVTEIPVRVWKGRPLEGIVISVFLGEVGKAFIGKSEYSNKWGFAGYHEMLANVEPDVAKLYSANLRQLIADLIGVFVLGSFVGGALLEFNKSYAKTHDNKSFSNALKNTGVGLLVSMYNQSTEDFAAVSSILRVHGRSPNWTPFSWTKISNTVNNFKTVLNGDLSIPSGLYDAIVKSAAGTKQIMPIMDHVKLAYTGRKVGEKEK